MHALLRSSHSYKLLKRSTHSNRALKCLCNESDQIKKYSSVHFQVAIPTSLIHTTSSHNNLRPNYLHSAIRNFSLTHISFDKEPLKPSSKIEVTVQEIKKQKEELPATAPPKAVVKKSLKQKIIDELVHYYHGFRLLFIDVKISSGLVWRLLKGKSLTRREHRLLVRTVGDMFRLVPFSVFIIVPFMEFLLPVFIKLFPSMLPSTFETTSEKENKIKQNLKVKLEMAKFLQQTLDNMAVEHKDHNSEQAKEFNEWFHKVRQSGAEVTNQEIMKYSKLFEDEITLDSLSRNQLIALCKVLEVQTLGTNNFLRFQLRMKIRSLAADDKMIQKEGIDSLTLYEVQQACRARGMRAYGLPEVRLRSQLAQWLDLSLNEKVPPSLLLLSRALMLPDAIPTHDQLKATISVLPVTIGAQTEVAIGEKEGKIDNKIKIQVIKEEERKIKEERKEQREHLKKIEEEKKEVLVDKAPIITAEATPHLQDTAKVVSVTTEKPLEAKTEELVANDLQVIEHALENISKDTKKFVVEKEVIQDLKEEMADYQEDVQELKQATADEVKPAVQETKAAQRLFKKINRMIVKLDTAVEHLQNKEKQLKKDLETESTDKKKEELLEIDEILDAIKKVKTLPDYSRLEQIKKVLAKMDDDSDGSLKVEDVLKVIELIGNENVKLSGKQVDEIIDLLEKEEILEVENKIEKALQKQREIKAEAQATKSSEVKQASEDDTPVTPNEKNETKVSFKSVDEPKSPPSKMESQPSILPRPPINSIDPKSRNNSKTL
ncbi:hypothetical protein PPYR_06509 [Photinus pyralis]|uniref:Mitochondrial proton/calcium exchanger protein n=3 Tax=Photinus pyralis TaxID=7054 RepID=A0A5N4AU79_PHOPY|nr:mitochondrial proton/calcium exchanger protein-like [Photinus pyralis]XP_031337858.1 mitochondrial proton/calcium exchanger protein-like [Photinus pyralis]KAB0800770.1 hypothetical protein PPYR_06509 [Photinus pyralis]